MTQEMSTAEYHAMVSEKVFTQQVMNEARSHNWLVYHTHDSRRSEPGFPDIVAAHFEHGVIFAELKTVKGRLKEAQRDWIAALKDSGARAYLWRPTDWDEIRAVFAGETR